MTTFWQGLKPKTLIHFHGPIRRHIAGSFGLKIVFTGLNIVTALLLARLLGVEGFGVYVLCLAVVRLLLIPSLFGLPELLVREVAAFSIDERWAELRGLLRWSLKLSTMISLGILAVNITISPTISILYAENKIQELRMVVRKGTGLMPAISMAIGLPVVLLGPVLIRLFFDEGFKACIDPLRILCIGQMCFSLAGCLPVVLNMTHKERSTMICMAGATVSNILLNFILVPWYGPLGAAIASSAGFLVLSVLLILSVYRHYRFLPFPLF